MLANLVARTRLAHAARIVALGVATLASGAPLAAQSPCAEWSTRLTSPSLPIAPLEHANVAYDDGQGPTLYVGQLGGLYRLNGSAWELVLACTQPGFTMNALCAGTLAGTPLLFAAETDSTPPIGSTSNVWSFDGSTWNALGSPQMVVSGLVLLDTGGGPELYAFGLTGSGSASVVRRSGTTWTPLGAPIFGGTFRALAVSRISGSPEIYAAGNAIGPTLQSRNTVRWNGLNWAPLADTGTFDAAFSLASVDFGGGERLYVGFTSSSATAALRSYDGTTWTDHALQAATFTSLELVDTPAPKLLVGGRINTGSTTFPGILEFDGTNLLPYAPPLFGTGATFETVSFTRGSTLHTFAIGAFTRAGSTLCNGIAEWDGTDWSTIGRGLFSSFTTPGVNAFTRFDFGNGPELVAAGRFTGAGVASDVFVGVARWDGTRWDALGAGASLSTDGGTSPATPLALASADFGAGPQLFVGGMSLQGVGGRCWLVRTPVGWNAIATSGQVHALCVGDVGAGLRVFAGGTNISGGLRVMQFNGTTATQVGTVGGIVYALTIHDAGSGPELYAAGSFVSASGSPAANIARWDGTAWRALGSGLLGGEVRALATFGSYLWAGGSFTTAGSVAAPCLARWDGTQWLAAPGGGANGTVRALAVHDDGRGPALYAGGDFDATSGVSARRLARYDGHIWSQVDGGTDAPVSALASADDDGDGDAELFVGGSFRRAGDVWSGLLARLEGCPPVRSICSGDGSSGDHFAACPCGNAGAPGHGCANSVDANGALLAASGATQADTLVLDASGMPASALGIYLQHDATGDALFHDGVICAGGNLLRLRSRVAAGGASRFPDTTFANDATLTLSQRGGVTPGSGVVRFYSTFYRNASTSFCPPATANVTNGVRVVW